MGYCACRRSESPPLYPVVLFLSVVAILVALPWFFSSEPVVEVVTPKLQINWALIVTPLLLLALVHWLSSVEPPRRSCRMPPPSWPVWCHCRGKAKKMAYGKRRSTTTSILEIFSLNPVPYPVLLIMAVTLVFLGMTWYLSYDSVVESAEEQMSWVLFVVPVVLILIVRWLSSMENLDGTLFGMSPWERRRRTHHRPSEGGSPWAVAAFIVLLLVLLQYQSIFLDSWLI
ncbi:hypothetical protein TIFTF001_017838 [Ficus carica]|uniref:Transmembrane protein n=1 Tax=Ficus carica TaxID=3494 RepID=A0AA88D8Q5_FICCA|nr:hypothetical protein TIFTF001_017838 [Ficus carica]